MNPYQGSTMSDRSSPKTSQGMARSKVRAPSSTTAATVLTGASPAADGRDHVDPGAGLDGGVEARALLIDVDVDVPAKRRARLAQPVAQAGPLLVQPVDDLADGARLDVEPARQGAAEQRWQGRGEVDLAHQPTSATSTEAI